MIASGSGHPDIAFSLQADNGKIGLAHIAPTLLYTQQLQTWKLYLNTPDGRIRVVQLTMCSDCRADANSGGIGTQ